MSGNEAVHFLSLLDSLLSVTQSIPTLCSIIIQNFTYHFISNSGLVNKDVREYYLYRQWPS